jgi:hypothetical protein
MAKVKGGLFSSSPRGSIGGVITYQGRTGYFHAHRKADPVNRKTNSQLADRVLFSSAVATWHLLSDSDKELYNSKSSLYNNITGFNIFISTSKGFTPYWIQFNKVQFGMSKKFGGPSASRLR